MYKKLFQDIAAIAVLTPVAYQIHRVNKMQEQVDHAATHGIKASIRTTFMGKGPMTELQVEGNRSIPKKATPPNDREYPDISGFMTP